MKQTILLFILMFNCNFIFGQLSPAITSWLQNTTETGSYYMVGNSTALDNGILYNCQKVEYSDEFVYISTRGIPAYPTGPFQDGNPSQASDQDVIFQIPLNPEANTGQPDQTRGGNIGIFINGVALFDYRDGVAWNSQTNSLCGGPGNPPCPGGPMAQSAWNRDAIPAEREGFDCSKAHPAMGNYHHHQNPSAFKLDLNVISDVCNLYDAEGLYAINPDEHSPLIGYAYDGFPIYGAYGFKNADGSGGIARMNSSYQLRVISFRTDYPDGTNVDDGPDVSSEYPLGYFREDYEFIEHPGEEDFLDVHNGRFCITPEYPDGTYAYFATVNQNWNSTYPYVVGPTFYGHFERRNVNSVNEPTMIYDASTSTLDLSDSNLFIEVIPNPASDLIAVQIHDLVDSDCLVELIDLSGKLISSKRINAGTTIAYFDVQAVYTGNYLIKITNGVHQITKSVVIAR